MDLFVCVGVKMFFVSGQGGVTTLSQPQTLKAFQFVNYKPGTVMQFTGKKNCRNHQTRALLIIIYITPYIHSYFHKKFKNCSIASSLLVCTEAKEWVKYVYVHAHKR